LLAHHYTQAGLNEQAVPYWQQAGQRAIERSAHVEAITHLTKGLELLATLPETPARAHNELQFHCVLGTSLIATRGFAAAAVEQTYARARELCQQLQDTQQLFSVFVGLWGFYDVRDQLPQARDMGEQLLALAHRQHDPGLLVPAHRMLGETIFWLGELGEARAHLEQSMALTTHSNTGPMASATAMMPAPVASAS
jgi:predicted ATPase